MGIGPKTTLALTDKKSAAKAKNHRFVTRLEAHEAHSFESESQALQISKIALNYSEITPNRAKISLNRLKSTPK